MTTKLKSVNRVRFNDPPPYFCVSVFLDCVEVSKNKELLTQEYFNSVSQKQEKIKEAKQFVFDLAQGYNFCAIEVKRFDE